MALNRRLFLCVIVSDGVSWTSRFSVLPFSSLPLSCKGNLLITGFVWVRRLKGQVTFLSVHSHHFFSLCGDEWSGFNSVSKQASNSSTNIFICPLSQVRYFQLTPVRVHFMDARVCWSVFCNHMMGLESRRWQITCNCDLLWWRINFAALHAVR